MFIVLQDHQKTVGFGGRVALRFFVSWGVLLVTMLIINGIYGDLENIFNKGISGQWAVWNLILYMLGVLVPISLLLALTEVGSTGKAFGWGLFIGFFFTIGVEMMGLWYRHWDGTEVVLVDVLGFTIVCGLIAVFLHRLVALPGERNKVAKKY